MNEDKREILLQNLLRKLRDEIEYKKACDMGGIYAVDDFGEDYLVSYYPNNWQSEIIQLLRETSSNPEELQAILTQFSSKIEKGSVEEFVSASFRSELSKNIKRITLEKTLMRDDVVDYVSNLSKEELESMFGKEIAQMKDFDQKNVHHCYDLLGHTLHTVEAISHDGLTDEQFKKLRIAAFFHDVGKPEVAQFNEKTRQRVFYGHAQRSMEIAGHILEDLGYSRPDIDELQFYIGHHDDFISYKSQLAPWMKQHEFVRGINPETVAEKIIENEYDFSKMGFNKDQIRYICFALAHGENPEFMLGGKPVEIDIDMNEVHRKMQLDSRYKTKPKFTLDNYRMLLNLCRADAGAQSEVVIQNGKKVSSRAEKIDNMDNIESSLERAMEISDGVRMSSKIIGQILEETSEEIYNDFADMSCYEGYRSPIEDLEFWGEFDDKTPEFITNLRAMIIQNMPKKFDENSPKLYGLMGMNYGEDIFSESFTKHMAEAIVDLDDINDEKVQKDSPLRAKEEELSRLEKYERILEEMERLQRLIEGKGSNDNPSLE